MGELIITENITVDGVIDAAKGWFDPTDDDGVDRSDLQAVVRAQSERSSAFLAGRATFEAFRSFWPQQTDDTTGVTDHLNAVRKYVVSATIDDPGWAPTSVLRGDLRAEIETVKAAEPSDIVVTGSMQLTRALIELGLVDEYRLFVYPFVAGEGHRLFGDATALGDLELVEARTFTCGVQLLVYRPA